MRFADELVAAASEVFDSHLSRQRKVTVLAHPYQRPSIQPSPSTLPSLPLEWPPIFKQSIDAALDKAWAPSTTKLYNRSIQSFLAFCQRYSIPESLVYPASDYLLCAFIASQPPSSSKSSVKNLLSGLRAWHIRNGHPFVRSDRLNLIAHADRPHAVLNPPRPPVSIMMLTALAEDLRPDDPLDTCILACATSAFWGLARLGEFLPSSLTSFDPNEPPYPTLEDLTHGTLDSITIHLPWTKTLKWKGDTITISRQSGPTAPGPAIAAHVKTNNLQAEDLLFSYTTGNSLSLLTKPVFMARCNSIWAKHNLPTATGHSFRIGGTSHLLLCGIHPDIIKKAGRWSSDSFLRYWRNLDIVIPQHISNASFADQGGDPRQRLGWGQAKAGGLASSSRDPPQGTVPTGL